MKRWMAAWLAVAACAAAAAQQQAPKPAPAPAVKGDMTINLSGVTLQALVLYISDVTGKPVLLPANFPGEKRVDVVSGREVKAPADKVMGVIAATLRNAGYALVETADYIRLAPENAVEGAPLADAGEPRLLGEASLVTTLVDVKHVEAKNLVPALEAVKSKAGSVRVYEEANKLIIRDYASNLQPILRMVRELDAASETTVREIYRLKHRSVESLQTVMASFVASMGKETDPLARRRLQTFSVFPYASQNAFVLMGRPDDVAKARGLIETLDVESTDASRGIQTYVVVHRDASEMATIVTNAINAEKAGAGKGAETGGPSPTVIADKANNALLVIATPDKYAELLPLFRDLDRPKSQVLIEAALVELSMERYMDLGLELATGDQPGGGIRVLGGTTFGLSSITTSGRTPVPPAKGGVTLGLFKDSALNIPVLLRLSAQDSGVSFLAAPQLMTSDNQKASVVIAEEREYMKKTVSSEGTTTDVTSGGYNKASITLEITPQISENGRVRMKVRQVTEQFLPSTDTETGYPLTNKSSRTADTEVTVPDGRTVIIAGLTRTVKTETISKVPFIGDIPWLGYLFRRTETDHQQMNLCVFITPRIVRTEADMARETQRQKGELRAMSETSAIKLHESDFERVTGGRVSPAPQKEEAMEAPGQP